MSPFSSIVSTLDRIEIVDDGDPIQTSLAISGLLKTAGFTLPDEELHGGALNIVGPTEAPNLRVISDAKADYDFALTDGAMFSFPNLRELRNCELYFNRIVVGGDLLIDHSTLGLLEDVSAGSLALTNGTYLSHKAATTTSVYRLELEAGDVSIDASSRIDVTGKGYLAEHTRGNVGHYGFHGGSYGGLGSSAGDGNPLPVYGSLYDPNDLGSGVVTYWNNAGAGGGLIKLRAQNLQVDGSLLADGVDGGSGGGINLTTNTLTGTGSVRANGAIGLANGGGGRIAITYKGWA